MHRWWIDRWRLLFSGKLSLIYLSLLCVWTHQCSFHRCGPVRNHHRTRSGTSLEGSGKFQTHRCSGNYTHRCLGRERQNVRYTSLNENKKSRNETRESLNVTERVRHLDRPCCLLWEWSPSHTRSGSHPERSDTGRSRTGSRCLRTHPCLKQNRPVSHKAHCTLHGYPIRIYLEGQQSNRSRKIRLHWSPPCMYTCRIPVCWHSLHWDCSCGPLRSTHPDLKRKKCWETKHWKRNLYFVLEYSQYTIRLSGQQTTSPRRYSEKCTHPHTWCRLQSSHPDSDTWSFQAHWCRQHACRSYGRRSHTHQHLEKYEGQLVSC